MYYVTKIFKINIVCKTHTRSSHESDWYRKRNSTCVHHVGGILDICAVLVPTKRHNVSRVIGFSRSVIECHTIFRDNAVRSGEGVSGTSTVKETTIRRVQTRKITQFRRHVRLCCKWFVIRYFRDVLLLSVCSRDVQRVSRPYDRLFNKKKHTLYAFQFIICFDLKPQSGEASCTRSCGVWNYFFTVNFFQWRVGLACLSSGTFRTVRYRKRVKFRTSLESS